MCETLSNAVIALGMYLVLMANNCRAERSFSKVNQIENIVRTSMTHERQDNRAIISIESDILHGIDIAVVINDFAMAKSRKVSGL